MPHMLDRFTGDEARKRALQPRPFGPGFNEADLEHLDKMEVHGSSFDDPGADWVEFRIFDADGSLLDSVRVAGY